VDTLYFRWNRKKGQAVAKDCGRERQLKDSIEARNS